MFVRKVAGSLRISLCRGGSAGGSAAFSLARTRLASPLSKGIYPGAFDNRIMRFSTLGEVDKTYEEPVVKAGKRSIPQSQWKMSFLVTLIRNAWVPDALAQLKFSPKPRCEDVSKIVKRAASVAGIYHGGDLSIFVYLMLKHLLAWMISKFHFLSH